jgi:hypothetical protein
MEQKSVPAPVVVALIAIVIIVAGIFLYKGATGGTVGEGQPAASPPMPAAARQQMVQQMQRH